MVRISIEKQFFQEVFFIVSFIAIIANWISLYLISLSSETIFGCSSQELTQQCQCVMESM